MHERERETLGEDFCYEATYSKEVKKIQKMMKMFIKRIYYNCNLTSFLD